MSKFHVNSTFEIETATGLRLFVLAGTIVEGEIRAGMLVYVPFNSSFAVTERIDRIEFALRDGGEDVCLCFEARPEALEFWRDLNIRDETLEITNDGMVC